MPHLTKQSELKNCGQAETPMSDHVNRFWRLLETEHVRIIVDLKREIGLDASDGPIFYWDCSTFSDDVAKALVKERNTRPASAGVREALEELLRKSKDKRKQVEHYRVALASLDHAKTIAGGRVLQLDQIIDWIDSALSDHGVQESAEQTSIARKQATEATCNSATEFSSLQEANIARQKEWDPDNRITLAYRGNELAGEVGEACNVIKKLERERLGINGSRDTVEHLLEELADSVICSYLVAMHVGGDLEAAIVAKFNATSEKMGLKTRMRFTKSDGSYVLCENCRGTGLAVNEIGEPDICKMCGGNTVVPSDSLLSKTLSEGEQRSIARKQSTDPTSAPVPSPALRAYQALFEPPESDAYDNLTGALYDIKRHIEAGNPTDDVCVRTIERVLDQLNAAYTALAPANEGSSLSPDGGIV